MPMSSSNSSNDENPIATVVPDQTSIAEEIKSIHYSDIVMKNILLT